MNQEHGKAYEAVRIIYENSPGRSWQRLNSALYQTLMASITAHLSFLPSDFQAFRAMYGHYWMGNSVGSTCGEAFYIHAVAVSHTPACISFEQYAERPAALWAEDVKTPVRLCIGSRFTWKGLLVTVTNMKQDRLIACTYKHDTGKFGEKIKVGQHHYFAGDFRKVISLKESGRGGISVKLGPKEEESRKPERVFTITYQQLAARRKDHDISLKKALADIAKTEDAKALTSVINTLTALGKESYRPYDISTIQAAARSKRESFKERGAA